MGLAAVRASRERSLEMPLDEAALNEIEPLAFQMGSNVTEELLAQDVEHEAIALTTRLHLRYAGSDTAIAVPLSEPHFMRTDFEALHMSRFGFTSPGKALVISAIEVEACADSADALDAVGTRSPVTSPSNARENTHASSQGGTGMMRVSIMRPDLASGHSITGPALVIEPQPDHRRRCRMAAYRHAARRSGSDAHGPARTRSALDSG